MDAKALCGTPANSPDFGEVAVLFADPEITSLFAELLLVRGVRASILVHPEQVSPNTKVITEAQFLGSLPPECQQTVLCVGTPSILAGKPGIPLCQPLTAHKIEEAFSAFLQQE